MDITQIKAYCKEIRERIEREQIACFEGMDRPLFFICMKYPGIWLEHVQDAILYAEMEPAATPVAKNTLDLFIDRQTEEGQYPCYVLDPARTHSGYKEMVGYSQLQECVSFASLCLRYVKRTGDAGMLGKAYRAGVKWVGWLKKYRMTTGRGLVEMFVGYDTGHDWSGRLNGLSCMGNYVKDGKHQNASILPPDDDVAPALAVDLNCNFYATHRALAEMARMLGKEAEAEQWEKGAAEIKKNLFRYCYNAGDAFFYDVDKHGNQRKYLSCTIFHLFQEGVLDEKEDAEAVRQIKERHIKNPNEFWTPYPFPSMAVSDPSTENHAKMNSWGYFTMGLIVLRANLWMDRYGMGEEFDHVCRRWLEAWTEHYGIIKFGQELDPITGVPSPCAEWYSATMVSYLYAARRLGIA